ncbi:MAG: hypothetical protein EBR67_10910, partial [Proteobacteria bacterium]|nr:hypothetical protein [Pseudomonadota bacterium]
MPLLDPIHFIQKVGRTKGATKTYVTSLVTDKGTSSTTSDSLTFTNLEIELDGEKFKSTKTVNFTALSSLLEVSKQYAVFAVPAYTEPNSQSSAEAVGLDYYVSQNSKGEAIAYRFFPSNVLAQINAAGGIAKVKQSRFFNPTPADIVTYDTYYEQVERLQDPKFVIKALIPSGYDIVLGELKYVDNTASSNVLPTKTRSEFRTIKSQLGEVNSVRKILTGAEATTQFSNSLWLIKTAKSYSSLSDAQLDNNGTDVSAAIIAADAASTSYTFSASHYVIQEYILAGTTDIGQTFKGYIV